MNTPPKTKLTFSVGFTGHRSLPDADLETLRGQIDAVLRSVQAVVAQVQEKNREFFSEGLAELRVLSMLAEGADRLFTECGLALGYHFQCALPMSRGEYERDFETAESKEAFRKLLQQADTVLEIETCTAVRSRAYQDCGHVLLEQSDLLVTIWDGKDSGKVGGTSDIIASAVGSGIPVLWIDAAAGHSIQLIHGDHVETDWQNGLRKVVTNISDPSGDAENGNGANAQMHRLYLEEDIDKQSRIKLYQHFVNLVLRRKGKGGDARATHRTNAFFENNYLRYYEAVNHLAMYYRDIYRSCGLLRQLLPFLASVGLALGFYATLFGGPVQIAPAEQAVLNVVSNIGFLMQAVCFVLIIVLSKIEKKQHWHQKFTDYRALSELLRHMEYLAPMGIAVRGLRVSAFQNDLNGSWVYAQFRAISRQAGLPNVTIDAKYLSGQTAVLDDTILKGQIGYHNDTAANMLLINRRLERFGFAVYYLGIIVVALRVVEHALLSGSLLTGLNPVQEGYIGSFFNMLSFMIPVFSALSFGISSQEGFERIHKISDHMKQKLVSMRENIAAEQAIDFNMYKNLSQRCANIMLSEFSDWNTFIRSKNISDH